MFSRVDSCWIVNKSFLINCKRERKRALNEWTLRNSMTDLRQRLANFSNCWMEKSLIKYAKVYSTRGLLCSRIALESYTNCRAVLSTIGCWGILLIIWLISCSICGWDSEVIRQSNIFFTPKIQVSAMYRNSCSFWYLRGSIISKISLRNILFPGCDL
jgi:hypothetical protein